MEIDGGTGLLPQAIELPLHILIYRSNIAVVPRAARCVVFGVRHGYRLSRSGCRPRPQPRCGHDTDDVAHLLHARARSSRAQLRVEFVIKRAAATTASKASNGVENKPRGQGGGTDAEWEEATMGVARRRRGRRHEMVMDEGGGAFYVRKVSVQAREDIGAPGNVNHSDTRPAAAASASNSRSRRDNERHDR